MGQSSRSTRRPQQSLRPAHAFLLVEGRTEENYFRICKNRGQNSLFRRLKIRNPGNTGNTSDLDFKREINYYKGNQKFKKVKYYCVFDIGKDEISLNSMQTLKKKEENEIILCPSKPCFELWLLFHYKYTNREYAKCKKIIDILQKVLKQEGLPEYEKPNIDPAFIQKLGTAVANSKKSCRHLEKQISNQNPPCYTEIYKIFE